MTRVTRPDKLYLILFVIITAGIRNHDKAQGAEGNSRPRFLFSNHNVRRVRGESRPATGDNSITSDSTEGGDEYAPSCSPKGADSTPSK